MQNKKIFHPLLSAFSKVIKKYKNVYLFMAGKDINQNNKELFKIIKIRY